jgi:hypothetical protein
MRIDTKRIRPSSDNDEQIYNLVDRFPPPYPPQPTAKHTDRLVYGLPLNFDLRTAVLVIRPEYYSNNKNNCSVRNGIESKKTTFPAASDSVPDRRLPHGT